MADGFSMDLTDLTKLAVQFENVENELPKGTTGAMRGALYTGKQVWREGLEGSDVPASASTLWYRFSGGAGSLTGTIAPTLGSKRLRGYVKARELGSPTVTPGAHAAAAAAAAAGDLAKGLGIAGERAIQRALES